MENTTAKKLADSLPGRTAIIGGGGKTTLMLALAKELAGRKHSVLLTTTTHLAWPAPKFCTMISPKSAEELNRAAAPGWIVLAGYPSSEKRMVGLSPELFAQADYDYVLCEADGSHRLPLKVHRDGEPVIPDGTGLVIQVAGLSALGKTAGETVHRYPLLGLSPEEVVTPPLIARILQRGWNDWDGPGITILNQADTPEVFAQGVEIQRLLGRDTRICSLKKEHAPSWFD